MSLIIRRWRSSPLPHPDHHFNINTRSADNNAGRSSPRPTFRLCESPPAPSGSVAAFPASGEPRGGGSRLTTPSPLSRGAIESVYHFNYREFPSQPPQFPVSLPRIVAASSARLSRIIAIDTDTRRRVDLLTSKCQPIPCTRACDAVPR